MHLRSYAFTRGLDHAEVVAASERVAWTVDEIFAGRRFDARRPVVPAAWVGGDELPFLNERDHLLLNHCRAFSYVHLLGHYEAFLTPFLTGVVVRESGGGERASLRALIRLTDEELKHQELFARAERVLETSCGRRFGRSFDDGGRRVAELATAVLAHPPLATFLMLLAFEWGTQRHYVESVRSRSDAGADPLYGDLLKAHWVEEAQHTKTDALEVARLARTMSPVDIEAVFDHVLAIGGLVDATIADQVDCEIATLLEASDRRLMPAQREALRDALYRSLSTIITGVSLGHPRFAAAALELSPAGAAKLGITGVPAGPTA